MRVLLRRLAGSTTPGMKQWAELKEQSKGHLLLFRVGDFYECFAEDAQELSTLLNLQLTSRKEGVPMAGVPQHAVWTYVAKLRALGRSVALADQMESPEEAKSAGRRIVKRAITRVITPGTAVDDELLDEDCSAYLAAVAPASDGGAGLEVVWSDVAAGNGGTKRCASTAEASALLQALSVHELLLCGSLEEGRIPSVDATVRVVHMPEATSCEVAIRSHLRVSLSSGANADAAFAVQPSFARLRFDAATRQALDLQQSAMRVFTSAGHRHQPAALRLLRERIASPLSGAESGEIEARLRAVQWLLDRPEKQRLVQTLLTKGELYGDAERALQRIALGGAVHRSSLHLARDITAVCSALRVAGRLAEAVCEGSNSSDACERWAALRFVAEWAPWIDAALARVDVEDPLGIAASSDELLDKLRDPAGPREEIAEFEKQLAEECKVPAVKISRGRSPEELHFSVTEKFGELISAAARENHTLRYVGQRAHSTRWTTDVLEKMGNTVYCHSLCFL
jgi:DNA mismatch repair ATPase MutS